MFALSKLLMQLECYVLSSCSCNHESGSTCTYVYAQTQSH